MVLVSGSHLFQDVFSPFTQLEDFNDDSEFLSSSPEPDDNVPKYPG